MKCNEIRLNPYLEVIFCETEKARAKKLVIAIFIPQSAQCIYVYGFTLFLFHDFIHLSLFYMYYPSIIFTMKSNNQHN